MLNIPPGLGCRGGAGGADRIGCLLTGGRKCRGSRAWQNWAVFPDMPKVGSARILRGAAGMFKVLAGLLGFRPRCDRPFRRRARPWLEYLEDRLAPAAATTF